jgi:hypothetical protein
MARAITDLPGRRGIDLCGAGMVALRMRTSQSLGANRVSSNLAARQFG